LPHAAAKATEAAAPEATEAATTASTGCMAGTPTYGYACGPALHDERRTGFKQP
jgi:hypothetical protein